MFLYIKRQINNQRIVCCYQKSANQTANSGFCCKIWNATWGYLGFRATTQKHHMGLSGARSKQLRVPYGVSRARWVNGSSLEKLYMALVSNANSIVSDGFNLTAFDACDLIGIGVEWMAW